MLVYKTTQDTSYAIRWSLYSYIFIFFVVCFLGYAVKKGIFTDLDVSKREQRPLLFTISVVTGVLYILGIFLLHGPLILLITVFGILTGISIVSAVNTRIKASLHVATIAAVTFALSLVYGGKYWSLLIVIPLVGWARVRIKRHTIPETIVGAILGGVLSVSMYIVTKAILT
jgi:hypothetical protein